MASSLPKGSPERKAILAGLEKTSASVWSGRDSDRVKVHLESYTSSSASSNGGRAIWQGEVTVGEAKQMDKYLDALHRMAEENDLARLSDIDDEIKDLLDEKKSLGMKYGKAIAWAKKMKIWNHFANGGDTMIPVTFEDADGDWHRIFDNNIEML
jgi:hypothetical protein